MNEKLRKHIEMLFEDAPKTRKAFELKEELLANSEDRYQDLITSGVTPEDALQNVVSSLGNVSELFQELEETNSSDTKEFDANYKKTVLFKTTAVGIYLFSVVVLIGFALLNRVVHTNINLAMVGLLLMLLIDIIPTCMLVYITSLYQKYKKKEDTIVEDFKEWKSDSLKMKSIKKASISVVWTSAVLLYFAVSFATFAWFATWIIFLVALCVHTILELLFRLKELK